MAPAPLHFLKPGLLRAVYLREGRRVAGRVQVCARRRVTQAGCKTYPGAATPGHSSYRTSCSSTPPSLGLERISTARAAAILSSPIFPAGPLSATTQSTDLPFHVTRALQPHTTPTVFRMMRGGTT